MREYRVDRKDETVFFFTYCLWLTIIYYVGNCCTCTIQRHDKFNE